MFYIDSDALKKAKNDYMEYASQMKELKSKLEKAVDNLKTGWNTEAGKEFFKKYEDDWLNNLEDYIKVIEHMSDNMSIADNIYLTVFEEAKKVKL